MRKKTKRRLKIAGMILGVLAAVFLCFAGFFYVSDIHVTVVGSTRYTDQEIREMVFQNFADRNSLYLAFVKKSLDPGQAEASRSLGLGYLPTMIYIVIPQAFKAILPALSNEFIILLKDTSLITVIGGKELVYAAQGIMGRTYEAMYPLLGTAVIYLVLVMIFTWLQGKLERRLREGDRR